MTIFHKGLIKEAVGFVCVCVFNFTHISNEMAPMYQNLSRLLLHS